MEGEGWRVEGGGWRVEGGGWRVEGGGWRVATSPVESRREATATPVRFKVEGLVLCSGFRVSRSGFGAKS